ncbi:AMP-binding protein [Rhodococcus sp. USK10]|uniref:AMP-binding protein n=1 Tax=Rhodococcus sp. USK10 TaxID=2789739 RepID=UPI001C5DF056|nr:AMP-binding protein [Rhodococcus sp. USK10]QYB07088.1 AMP-binding protein [Rhodococcus sp. USK10]
MMGNERTLGALLARQAGCRGDAVFVHFDGRDVSYREFDGLATTAAVGLADLGVKRGDRVCIALPNGIDFLVASFGLMRLGAIQVPLSLEYRSAQVAYVIADAEPAVLITDCDFYSQHIAVLESSELESVLFVDPPADVTGRVSHHHWAGLLRRAANSASQMEPVAPSDPLAIIYTSGTTGDPKGVLLCHEHQLTLAENIAAGIGLSESDCFYNFYPLHHNTGLGIITGSVLVVGARMLLTERFSKSRFWSDVVVHECTTFYGMGPILEILNKDAGADAAASGHRLRVCFGIAIGQDQADRFGQRFGVDFVSGYGSTEVNMVAIAPMSHQHPGAAGRVLDMFDVAIVDETDRALPIGETGEVVVRPRRPFTTSSGYWRKEEATAATWRNLWAHTGDAARLDADGYLYFVDRMRDVIRHRGNNVSSFEVENVIITMETVSEVAVIPIASDLGDFDQDICAVVVVRDRFAFEPASIIALCGEQLPKYAVPRYIQVVDELPKTSTGKVRKALLRNADRATGRWDRVVDGARPGSAHQREVERA